MAELWYWFIKSNQIDANMPNYDMIHTSKTIIIKSQIISTQNHEVDDYLFVKKKDHKMNIWTWNKRNSNKKKTVWSFVCLALSDILWLILIIASNFHAICHAGVPPLNCSRAELAPWFFLESIYLQQIPWYFAIF